MIGRYLENTAEVIFKDNLEKRLELVLINGGVFKGVLIGINHNTLIIKTEYGIDTCRYEDVRYLKAYNSEKQSPKRLFNRETNMKRIIVYGVTSDRAYHKMESILEDMRYGDIKIVKKSKFPIEIELTNGDTYRTATANDNARGLKWNYAYIDKMISQDILNNIILPSFTVKCKEGDYYKRLKDSCEFY